MCAQHRPWRDYSARHGSTSVRRGGENGPFRWIGLVLDRKSDVTVGSKTCIGLTYLKLALLNIQWQVRNHDLGLSTAKGCGGRGRSRLCLLVLPRVLGDTADRRGSRSRAARGGLAAATATARGGGLAGLEDLVQAELHLVGHVAKCGGGDTWGEAGRGASACWYQADGERVAQTARPLVWLMETRQAASGAMKTKGAFDGAERDAGGRVCLCTCLMDRRTSGEGSAVKKLAVAV